jgi:hypothetical protein
MDNFTWLQKVTDAHLKCNYVTGTYYALNAKHRLVDVGVSVIGSGVADRDCEGRVPQNV